ncbi:MAG: TlpA family protein disulfide reductase [Saprospirales bacterium]|nr:MAG: TlpA family protein disulfide reductase [Saprospirales bacterium]
MKNPGPFLTTFFSAVITLNLFDCQVLATNSYDEIIITVQAFDFEPQEVELHLFNKIAVATPNEIGNSKIKTKAYGPAYYSLRSGRNRIEIYLLPGDSLHLDLNWGDPTGTVSFSGDRVVENQFLIDKHKAKEDNGWADFIGLYRSEPEEFQRKLDLGLYSIYSLIGELKSGGRADRTFVQMEMQYPDYRTALMAANYVQNHSRFNQVPPEDINYSEEEAQQSLLNLDNTNVDLLPLPVFREVLELHRRLIWEKRMNQEVYGQGYDIVMKERFRVLEKNFESGKIVEFIKFDYLSFLLRRSGPGDVDSHFAMFLAETENPVYIQAMKTDLKVWEPILPGMQVPDFKFENPDGDAIRLSDLRGKMVYIDVWASWCGPCRQEIPHWDKLVGEYSDRDIYFLAISLDATRESWESMLNSKEMKGIHVYAPGVWNSEFARHFNVRGIPRFILIDAEGRVILPQTERPSGNIRERLDQLLKS